MTMVVKNSLRKCELCDANALAVRELSALNERAFSRAMVLEKIMHDVRLKLKRIQRELEEIAQHVNAAS